MRKGVREQSLTVANKVLYGKFELNETILDIHI